MAHYKKKSDYTLTKRYNTNKMKYTADNIALNQSSRFRFILFVLIFFVTGLFSMHGALGINYIQCDDGTHISATTDEPSTDGINFASYPNCTVSNMQLVDLADADYPLSPHYFIFNKLTLAENPVLMYPSTTIHLPSSIHFINSKAVRGRSGNEGFCEPAWTWPAGGIYGWDYTNHLANGFDFSAAIDETTICSTNSGGGHGGRTPPRYIATIDAAEYKTADTTPLLLYYGGVSGESWNGGGGGNGGNGGAGGNSLELGGNGSRGGTPYGGDDPDISPGGNAGAYVVIITNDISLSDNSHISVDGVSGSNFLGFPGMGCAGWINCINVGSGGNGGGGGGGGGILLVSTVTNSISSTAQITANGGDGGQAAPGMLAGDNSGGSGGGGGGGAGGIVKFYSPSSLIIAPILEANPGIGGANIIGGDGASTSNGSIGQSGHTEISSAPIISMTEGAALCQDGMDNDLDGFIDFEDADCYNHIGDVSTALGITNPWTTANGPLPNIPTPLLGAKSLPSPNTWWHPLATDGSDGVCGDDISDTFNGDYGYITNIDGKRQYICYDYSVPQLLSVTNYGNTWFNAMTTKYKIITLNNSAGTSTDVISNSNDWYHCDATTGRIKSNGFSIPEYGTFKNNAPTNTMYCTDILNLLLPTTTPPFTECVGTHPADWKDCCSPGAIVGLTELDKCDNLCIYDMNHPVNICAASGACSSSSSYSGSDYISKDTCMFDLTNCFTTISSDPSKSCDMQRSDGDNKHFNCTLNQLCSVGAFVKTNTSTDRCCMGINATCINTTIPASEYDCTQMNNGRPYDPAFYSCEVSLEINGSNNLCCFYGLSPTFLAQAGLSISNSSFMCFKQNGQDVMADCCYDKSCLNKDLIPSYTVFSNNRVESLGSAFHTFDNFDVYNGSKIFDMMRRYNVSRSANSNIISVQRWDNGYTFDMSHFSYLEFDIAYTTPLSVSINGRDLGSLSKYLTNGDKISRWHHAVIPLHSGGNNFNAPLLSNGGLNFTLASLPAQVVIDNIILTPNGSSDLAYNSKNYYCTGGFEGWISDLDPPTTFTSQDLKTWSKYGAYLLTCNSQGSFGWTGTMCCGDDTKLVNYGEYFNDTQKGCFRGTPIQNGQSVGYIKNYVESSDMAKDELDKYSDSGIMYYNNTFVGCQLPALNSGLLHSTYGSTTGTELVTSFVNTQCEMRGDYYCMNGVWRSKVITSGYELSAAGSNIALKMMPEGPNLLKNGFEG